MKSLLALVCCCIAGPLAAGPGAAAGAHAERCAELIALFDEVIVNRFDYRILMFEDYELAEASDLRRAAEAECVAGAEGFGLDMIETALREIGVVPPDPAEAEAHD